MQRDHHAQDGWISRFVRRFGRLRQEEATRFGLAGHLPLSKRLVLKSQCTLLVAKAGNGLARIQQEMSAQRSWQRGRPPEHRSAGSVPTSVTIGIAIHQGRIYFTHLGEPGSARLEGMA